jgi:hypothetical protein
MKSVIGTKLLRFHVNKYPECLSSWGGSRTELESKVRKIFDKRHKEKEYNSNKEKYLRKRFDDYNHNKAKHQDRKQQEYNNNKGKHQDHKQQEYKQNKEKHQDRKQQEYDNNKEKHQNRKQQGYNINKEVILKRQKEKRDNRIASQTSKDMLDKFKNSGRYGPIFPCISCHQLNWKYKVKKVDNIFSEQVHHLDIDYVVNKQSRLFKKLDAYWICDRCNGETRSGKRPRMSSMNGLQCPWEDVPERLLALNEVGIQEEQSNIRN